MEGAQGDSREQFIRALSNYSECIKPYLRVAQERYVAGYYAIESQKFDINAYCSVERGFA
jgi:hypothetical protein